MTPKLLYKNLIVTASGTLGGSAVASGYDRENVIDCRPYTFWKASSSGTNSISVTFSAAQSVDSFGIVGHNFNTVGVSSLKLYYDSDPGEEITTWTQLASYTVADDNAIMARASSPQSSKRFKVEFVNSSGQPYLGVLYIGAALSFEFPPSAPRAPYEESISGETFMSKSGNVLGQSVRFNPIRINHQFKLITRSWLTATFLTFWDSYGKALIPFFYAVDLDESTDEIFYCWIDPDHVHITPYRILTYAETLDLKMRGVR